MKNHVSYRKLTAALTALAMTAVQCALLPGMPAGAAASESEGNDTLSTANAITAGDKITGVSDGSDPDYFCFTLNEDEAVQVTFDIEKAVSTNTSSKFWTVQLLSDGGGVIAELGVTGEVTSYALDPVGLGAGTYYIKVEGGYYHSDAAYTLGTSVMNGVWESESNDTVATADALTANVSVNGRLQSSSDVDYYSLTLAENGHIWLDFDLEKLPSGSNEYWTVSLRYKSGAEIASCRVTGEALRNRLGDFGLDAGEYYICVEHPYYYSSQVYSLTAGSDDAVWESENNDTAAAADVLTSGVPTGGRLLNGDDVDYYAVELAEDARLDLTLALDTVVSTTTSEYWKIRVLDDQLGEIAAYSLPGNQTEYTLNPVGLAAGTYYVEITSPYYYTTEPYRLTATVTPDSHWEAEHNDTYTQASTLWLDDNTYGRLCSGSDADYYSFTLEKDDTLDLTFSYGKNLNSSSVYYKVSILSVQDAVIRTYEIPGNQATNVLPTMGLDAGEYRLRVTYGGYYWTEQPYTIEAATGAHENWESESNDTLTRCDAIDMTAGTISGCLHTADDVDYYSFTLDGNYTLSPVFTLETPAADSSSTYWKVQLLDADGEPLTSETAVQGKALETALGDLSLGAGTYYVKVAYGGYYSSKAPFTISLHAAEKTYTLGDVNEDGNVNANDASAVLQAAARIGAKKPSGLTDTQTLAANVDRSSDAINANDASFILRFAAYRGAKGTKSIEEYFGYSE